MEIQLQSGQNISLRTATVADVEALQNLVKQYYEFDQIPYVPDEIESGLRTLLSDGSLGQAWLVLQGTQPAGYVIFTYGFDVEFGGRLATITDLYLDPGHRRQGLGGKVLQHVETFCRSIGLRGLELQVESDNTEARALYTKFGFRPADRIPMSKRIKPL
ncbi:MAG TPA: GNAT family N-acetyltransferase [Verrucomicrobiae bacterium]|jgi:ribosomal protein S18 acetylase RimI-like enzyme|nr:GNAT family N-acetyltransferase [Verrucomicrobiae bacterium]